MEDKDRLILVFYTDIRWLHDADIVTYLEAMANSFKFDDSIIKLIVPVRENSRVECINPVLLEKKKYKEVKKKVKELEKKFEETLKDLKNKG